LGYFDTYKNRLTIDGNNYAEINKNLLKQKISNSFKDSPSYEECEVTDNNGLSVIKEAVIVDNNTLGKDNGNKIIMMHPNYNIEVGNLVNYNSKLWLCTLDDEVEGLYKRGIIEECNYTLKCSMQQGDVIESDCIATNTTLYSVGLEETKVITLPDGKLSITLPNNTDTQQIDRGMRILHYNHAYEVTFVDYSENGLIILTLTEDELQDQDDLVNGVAWNGAETDIQHDYSIIIENGTSVDIQRYTTLQLSSLVYDNDDLVVNPQLTYVSNSPSICSVNSSGLITALSLGGCTITVNLTDNPSISKTIDLVVKSTTPVPKYSIAIEGTPDININSETTYVAKIYNNGVIYNSASVVWELSNTDGTTITYARIISQGGTGCIVKTYNALGVGKTLKLKAKLSTNYSIYKEIILEIVGLL
jgi:hypothetical protein